jgi:trk system potassium uptake protein TrkA
MYIIIVGAGKVGVNLASLLLAQNHEVLLIEKDRSKIPELRNSFGESVMEGAGSRVQVLKEGGANRADVVVAVTEKDEDNLVICQLAKTIFHCRRTIARVHDPRHEDIFVKLGVDATVSSTRIIDSLIEEQVQAEDMVIPLLTLRGGSVEIIEFELSVNSHAIGKKLKDIKPSEGSILISILRKDEVILPKGETELQVGDRVVALIKKGTEAGIKAILS